MNIIQNKYQGKNQQGSIFLYKARNNKQDSTQSENKQKSVHDIFPVIKPKDAAYFHYI